MIIRKKTPLQLENKRKEEEKESTKQYHTHANEAAKNPLNRYHKRTKDLTIIRPPTPPRREEPQPAGFPIGFFLSPLDFSTNDDTCPVQTFVNDDCHTHTDSIACENSCSDVSINITD